MPSGKLHNLGEHGLLKNSGGNLMGLKSGSRLRQNGERSMVSGDSRTGDLDGSDDTNRGSI